MAQPPPLALVDVTKSFDSVQAPRGAPLSSRAGEIHALCGESGAGRPTRFDADNIGDYDF